MSRTAEGRGRPVAAVLSVSAVAVLWVALLLPDALQGVTAATFLRVPLEGVLLALVLVALPRRALVPVSIVVGILLTAITLIKVLDRAVGSELGRPFDPVWDIGQIGAGAGVVSDSLHVPAGVVIAGAIVALVVCGALLVLAIVRLGRVVRIRPRRSARVLVALSAVGVVLTLVGVPVASTNDATLSVSTVDRVVASAATASAFQAALAAPDPHAAASGALATGPLAGKDVLLVFVESYGEVAVQGSSFSPGVDAALASGDSTLSAAGFSSRSGWLTSPTFGGISWLAHSTLQSGVWVPNQQVYDRLLQSDRSNLSQEFKSAGWHTVSDVPSDDGAWPEGQRYYGYDQMYNATNVGYKGPSFSYANMPDQFSLARFGQLELGSGHAPVMAEIDLVSSHFPWTPLPHLVPDGSLGDGSVFASQPAQGLTPTVAWQNRATVQKLYGQSIQYSLDSLTDFIATSHDPNLVVIMLGDHQPVQEVSGDHPSHRVPISIIAADPSVLKATDGWGWSRGLQPAPTAALWPMDAFRDRFLTAFAG